VGCFFIGMLLTPLDVISQTMLALPMWLLYDVGILFAGFLKPVQRDSSGQDDSAGACTCCCWMSPILSRPTVCCCGAGACSTCARSIRPTRATACGSA